jgi:hypothetical protein
MWKKEKTFSARSRTDSLSVCLSVVRVLQALLIPNTISQYLHH